MKPLRKLGIGCLLAAAALAVAGVASASAEQSTFCKVDETPCSSANHYSTGSEFVLKSKGPVKWAGYLFGFELQKTECGEFNLKGKTTTTGGSSQAVEVVISNATLSFCTGGVTTYALPAMRFDWISGTMNAGVKTSGLSFGFDPSCTYMGNEIEEKTTLVGGSPAVLTFEGAPVTPSPKGCGMTAKFFGEFEVAAPKPLYVSNS